MLRMYECTACRILGGRSDLVSDVVQTKSCRSVFGQNGEADLVTFPLENSHEIYRNLIKFSIRTEPCQRERLLSHEDCEIPSSPNLICPAPPRKVRGICDSRGGVGASMDDAIAPLLSTTRRGADCTLPPL